MNLDVEKEQVIQQLCAHYAQDHLSTGELEARFERVQRAPDRATLVTVLEGLPAMGPLVAAPAPLWTPGPHAGAPLDREKRYVAFFAEVRKEGFWRPAPLLRARVILGSLLFDLREAEIPVEGIDIDVEVYLGDAKILLPPGIGADVDCGAMMGDVKDKAGAGTPGAPRVRVRGQAVMGNIIVVTKLPRKEKLEGWRAQVNRWLGAGSGDA